MKYRLILIAIIIGVLGLVSAFVYAQSTPTPTETPAASSVIQQDIFVRGGPGRDYLPVGKLLAGDRVRPLSRNAQGDWVLIVYGKGYGWIRRDLAFWVENVDLLPIIDAANLTPSPVLPTTPTQTPILLPTFTPSGNWVQLNADAQSGFVRAGPGRTYLRLGQLLTGDVVEPVSQNQDGSWIMIRFGDGFGWVARNLVLWLDDIDSLPVISVDNLTPSPTFTATNTATSTSTPTNTATLTATATITPTSTSSSTPTITPSATSTDTPVPSATSTSTPMVPTDTPVPTATSTSTATLIPTIIPSATPTASLTLTDTATVVPTSNPTLTVVPTDTITPTIAPSATNTLTATVTPTATFTATVAPSVTPTEAVAAIVPSATVAVLPSQTPTDTTTPSPIPPTNTSTVTSSPTPAPPTQTALPSATFTVTAVPTTLVPLTSTPLVDLVPSATTAATDTIVNPTFTQSPTSTPEPTHAAGAANVPTATLIASGGSTVPSGGLAPEVLIAGIVLLAILGYAVFYWRGLTRSERYASGFVVDTCPICQRGQLIVESRQERLFGIPRVRHSVRCTECRSVLREMDEHHWRYAVDPLANPDLYQRFNGKIVDDQTLTDLSRDPTHRTGQRGSSASTTPPDFIDDDT